MATRITPHFTLEEFACRCGCQGHLKPEIRASIERTAQMLEAVRSDAGGHAVHLNCGYRCPKHNAEVGGEPHSQHLVGKAADITIEGLRPADVQRIARRNPLVGGVGYYSTFTHVDTGPRRSWKG